MFAVIWFLIFFLSPPTSGGSVSSYGESLSGSDEEHRLIAMYTARLASEAKYSVSLLLISYFPLSLSISLLSILSNPSSIPIVFVFKSLLLFLLTL